MLHHPILQAQYLQTLLFSTYHQIIWNQLPEHLATAKPWTLLSKAQLSWNSF